ncbi:carbohydrate-binding module family 13 protein [Rhizophagus irregularis DAOM 181602=DAOM 197198]|nr:carbohydrate-binding module family 13 protein [Rhizophagus irregularis DAOM 181602=DAOM 197198]
MEKNFDLIYKTSFENNSLLELQEFCNNLITKEPNKIFKSLNFSLISEKLLGLAQNQKLPSDPTNFSKEDFNALKNSLQHCVPHIRFYNLTSEEFADEVLPYKKIISKELYEDLLKYFLKPSIQSSKTSKPRITTEEINIDSIDFKIITIQHAELISKWIDRTEITDEIKNTYKFKLLLRGSRDGFTYKKFHEICDNQSRTVTIIKVKVSKEILGGYNPIEWKSDDSYGTTKDSFIFSFKRCNDIKNYILSRIINEKVATLNSFDRGPSFGISDLVLDGVFGKCGNFAYEKQISGTTDLFSDLFSVEEYEVFQITR